MNEEEMFKGGGTSVSTLMNRMGNVPPQQAYQHGSAVNDLGRQAYLQEQMMREQMAREQMVDTKPAKKKKKSLYSRFSDIKIMSYVEDIPIKEILLLFVLVFLLSNEKVFQYERMYLNIRVPERQDWVSYSAINSLIVVILYFMTSGIFLA